MKSEEVPDYQAENQDMTSGSFGLADDVAKHASGGEVANDDQVRIYRGPDRRKPSLKSFLYGAFNPRRRRIRRKEDRESSFIDWYPARLLIAAILIMLLSVVDGLLTIHLINAGAVELNPVLAPFVRNDPMWFALIKVVLTGIGIICLVVVSQARLAKRWPMEWVLYGLLAAYVTLDIYSYRLSMAIA